MSWVERDDGARIHYVTWGDRENPPLLMLHGLGSDNIGWIRQRRAFAKRYFCIAVDNLGSGRSDKPAGTYDLEHIAMDAVAVLDAEGVETAHVMGASMGGVLTQILGVLAPDRVRSLTLACTACRMQPWRAELLEDWAELVEEKGLRGFAAKNLEWIIGSRSLRRLYPFSVLLGPYLMRSSDDGFLGQVRGLLAIDETLRDRLPEITAPTLVVTGSQDILTPLADAEEVAAHIPTSELVAVRGAAHGFMVEDASIFNEIVLGFLDRVEGIADAQADVIPIDRKTG